MKTHSIQVYHLKKMEGVMIKKILFVIPLLILACVANAGLKSGWPFFAPNVSSETSVSGADKGDIIFDDSSDTYKGHNGSTWVTLSPTVGSLSITSLKTSAYTITTDDNLVLADTSGGTFALTLYDANGNTGRVLTIKKVASDSSFTVLTITPDSGDQIDGESSTTLNSSGETLKIVSDGTNWHILSREIPSKWTDFSPTSTAGFGTPTNDNYEYRRDGNDLLLRVSFDAGTVSSTEARISLPTGLTSITLPSTPGIEPCGIITRNQSSYASNGGMVLIESAKTYVTFSGTGVFDSSTVNPISKVYGDGVANTGESITFTARVPINGWNN